MRTSVVLHQAATPAAPALALRPWSLADVPALVEVCRDAELRRWTSHVVDDAADGVRWVGAQQRGWTTGERFAFAVLAQVQPGTAGEKLVGHVVLKGVASLGPAAEVGYWTAAHARGKSVAPRALEALSGWAFDTFAADGLERLDLRHHADNEASCRVAEKSGYALERVLPATALAPVDRHLHVRPRANA